MSDVAVLGAAQAWLMAHHHTTDLVPAPWQLVNALYEALGGDEARIQFLERQIETREQHWMPLPEVPHD